MKKTRKDWTTLPDEFLFSKDGDIDLRTADYYCGLWHLESLLGKLTPEAEGDSPHAEPADYVELPTSAMVVDF